MKTRFVLMATLALVCATSAQAQTTTPSPALPAWEQLTNAQRDELTAPIRERWNQKPGERTQMLERAKRWRAMSPQQRAHAHHGMDRFERMDPEKRKQARVMFERMRNLPEAERRALRGRWKQMTPEERKQWMEQNPAPR